MPNFKSIPDTTLAVHLTAGDLRSINREGIEPVVQMVTNLKKTIEAASNVRVRYAKSSTFRKLFDMGHTFFDRLVREGIIKRYSVGGIDWYDVEAFEKHLIENCEVNNQLRKAS